MGTERFLYLRNVRRGIDDAHGNSVCNSCSTTACKTIESTAPLVSEIRIAIKLKLVKLETSEVDYNCLKRLAPENPIRCFCNCQVTELAFSATLKLISATSVWKHLIEENNFPIEVHKFGRLSIQKQSWHHRLIVPIRG